MYNGKDYKTKSLFSELFPLGGHLDPKNRWLKIEELIPWDDLLLAYSRHFSDRGRPSKDGRLVLGLILLKHMTKLSDRGVVQSMLENPYQQHFCGYEQFMTGKVIDPSTLSRARKRVGAKFFKDLEDLCYGVLIEKKIIKAGGMLVDGTVIEEKIAYPNDVGLLNHAREKMVTIIKKVGKAVGKRYRTYTRKARQTFLGFNKKRRKSKKVIQRTKKAMLQFLRRNIKQAKEVIEIAQEKGHAVARWMKEHVRTAEEIYKQQLEMYKSKSHRVQDRIVSFHKPYVRPIVRGKGGRKQVEFGPKVAVSHVNGFAFVDTVNYDNYSEAGELKKQLETYVSRFGKTPSSLTGDKLYGNRENRRTLEEEGVRSALTPLGRPKKHDKKEKRWRRQKQRERNRIEGAFGNAKEHYGLDRIRYRGKEGGEVWVRLGFLGMNLMTAMKKV